MDTRVNDSKLEQTDLSWAKPTEKKKPVQYSYAIRPFIVKIKHLGLNILLSVHCLCNSGVPSGSPCNSPSLDPKKHTLTSNNKNRQSNPLVLLKWVCMRLYDDSELI